MTLFFGVITTTVAAGAPGADAWAQEAAYSTVVLRASFSLNGSTDRTVSYHFEYGTNTSYGTSLPVPDGQVVLDPNQMVTNVDAQVSGLAASTTYHFRIVATNTEGTVYSADKTFTTFARSAEEAQACPNAAYRSGASAHLPDCRAYEMVSPVEKNGADVMAQAYGGFAAAASGERVVYGTRTGMGETKGSGYGGYSTFMATRGAEHWSTHGILPTSALTDPIQAFAGITKIEDLSTDLDRATVTAFDLPGVAGTPPLTQNLYLEDTLEDNVLEAVTRFEGFEEPVSFFSWGFLPRWGGGSSDLSVISFQMTTNLVPQAEGGGSKVYELDHGKVKLASLLPDGALPVEAELVRGNAGSIVHKDTVSEDGSRVLFYATPEGERRQLYMRKNGTSTVLVSESEASEATPAQSLEFFAATPDGTQVVFGTPTRLVDSDPGGRGWALYRYSDGPDPKSESNLTYIGRIGEFGLENYGYEPEEGDVVKGISDDGSHIYFYSEWGYSLPSLTGESALYLWDEGHITQVAPQVGTPSNVRFVNERYELETFVSPDGHRLAFKNGRPMTANQVVAGSAAPTQIYLYDEDTNTLRCASCPTTGTPPTTGVERQVEGTKPSNPNFEMDQLHRFYSNNGRFIFFNTSEALVPQDTNGLPDAYEYSTETGKLSLLSTGTGETGTWFVEASADGRDVFLATRQRLSRWDPDNLDDLYDARIDGGLPEPPVLPTPCDGDACQGTPSAAPSFNTASEFNGLGNSAAATPAAKGKTERHLTRAQRLRRALALCKKKRSKGRRAACRTAARRRYAAAQKSVKRAARVGR